MSYPTVDEMIATVKSRLAGQYEGPDSYYRDKDLLRRLEAKKRGLKEHEHDPMGFWFGGMSN